MVSGCWDAVLIARMGSYVLFTGAGCESVCVESAPPIDCHVATYPSPSIKRTGSMSSKDGTIIQHVS